MRSASRHETATDNNASTSDEKTWRTLLYVPITVPPKVSESILGLLRSYGLRFGAIDLAVDETGKWVFFELNPNGQWACLDLVGASDIAESFLASFRQ